MWGPHVSEKMVWVSHFSFFFFSLLFSPGSLEQVRRQRRREVAGGGMGTTAGGEGERGGRSDGGGGRGREVVSGATASSAAEMLERAGCSTSGHAAGERHALLVDPLSLPRLLVLHCHPLRALPPRLPLGGPLPLLHLRCRLPRCRASLIEEEKERREKTEEKEKKREEKKCAADMWPHILFFLTRMPRQRNHPYILP